jgi:hypothetical protein
LDRVHPVQTQEHPEARQVKILPGISVTAISKDRGLSVVVYVVKERWIESSSTIERSKLGVDFKAHFH